MNQNLDLNRLMKLSRSPAGQQLIQLLQQKGGNELQAAVQKASSGDYQQAAQALSPLLDSPEARQLLKTLEESK